ncbi:MAG: polysaccharide deacetylase family protein [Myxococcota bacterium]|nr:polysaccharide deacetylase family protein [Myxococcota bacterium]
MPTIAEDLGFDASDRVAIIHVDDIGMCHAANEGAFQALLSGPATCGSLMVPCPWFQEAANRAKEHPELDLGVHLTLNSEWPHYRWGPVAGRGSVPSLLDDEGFLPRTTFEAAAKAKPEEALIELRAQVQMALDAGIDVTHIDTHMGTCFFPSLIDVYQQVAEEFRLPAFAARPNLPALKEAGLEGAAAILNQVVDNLEAKGFPVLDHFCADSLSFSEGTGAAHMGRRLDGLQTGLNYVICHPAQESLELSHVTPDSAHQRDFERTFFGGEAGHEALASRAIKTVGMRPLRDWLRRNG